MILCGERNIQSQSWLLTTVLSNSSPTRTYIQLPDQPRTVPDQRHRPVQWPALPFRLHLPPAACRALPNVSLRGSVHARKQPDGHWKYLRAGSQAALQCCWVGQEHPLLSRPSAHGSGELATWMTDKAKHNLTQAALVSPQCRVFTIINANKKIRA